MQNHLRRAKKLAKKRKRHNDWKKKNRLAKVVPTIKILMAVEKKRVIGYNKEKGEQMFEKYTTTKMARVSQKRYREYREHQENERQKSINQVLIK